MSSISFVIPLEEEADFISNHRLYPLCSFYTLHSSLQSPDYYLSPISIHPTTLFWFCDDPAEHPKQLCMEPKKQSCWSNDESFTKEKRKGVFLSEFTWLHHFLSFAFKISSKAQSWTWMSFLIPVVQNKWAHCPFSSYIINSKSSCWRRRRQRSCSISRLPTCTRHRITGQLCLEGMSGGHLLQPPAQSI